MVKVEVRAENREQFITDVNKAIDDGLTSMWKRDSDGDYYLSNPLWLGKAWMRLVYDEDYEQTLYFVIIEPVKQKLSKSTYAVFHAKMAQMLLTLFDKDIESLSISPLLTKYDIYSKK